MARRSLWFAPTPLSRLSLPPALLLTFWVLTSLTFCQCLKVTLLHPTAELLVKLCSFSVSLSSFLMESSTISSPRATALGWTICSEVFPLPHFQEKTTHWCWAWYWFSFGQWHASRWYGRFLKSTCTLGFVFLCLWSCHEKNSPELSAAPRSGRRPCEQNLAVKPILDQPTPTRL